ncbi:MAG TPA: methyltransferase domain-containing protein [Caulobacteraceae bacterium]|jgi:SAM-dependent methyltransferase
MTQPPRLFDRDLHRQRLTRAARQGGRADFLKRRAAEDLTLRLEAINRRFPLAVDLGARGGGFAQALAASDATGKIDVLVQADLSAAMLAQAQGPRVVADEARMPFAPESLDLIVSSLALHWVDDLVGALVQIRLALKPDGLFLGALFGGASLTELRQCLTEAEVELTGGAGPRVSPFLDAYDGAALMQRAGFALPVVDVDKVIVRYDHPLRLAADLRAMGETNVLLDRPRQPLTRPILARACALYQQRFGAADGRIPATFEIITLTGWAPHPDQQQPLRPGSAKARLADALHAREQDAGDKAKP